MSNQNSLLNTNLLSADRDALNIETLLNNPSEWQSNPVESTRQCLKSLYNLFKNSQSEISNLEISKASKTDLSSALSIKANVADIMRTFSEVATNIENRPTKEEIQIFLDEKVSKEDLSNAIANKPSYEDIRNKLGNGDLKINLKLSMDELKNNFVSIKDFNEFINNSKSNRENIISILHKKANKGDLDNLKNTKLNTQDFNDFINNYEAKHNERLENIEKTMFENSDKKYAKKIEDIDNDIDRLVSNIKKDFQNVHNAINNLTTSKVDYKEIENFVKSSKSNDDFLNKTRMELFDTLNKTKLELFNSLSKLDERSNKQNNDLTSQFVDNLSQVKSEFQNNLNYFNDEIIKLNKIVSQTSNQNDLSLLNKKLEELSDLIGSKKANLSEEENKNLENKFVTYNELDNFYKTVQKNIDNKFSDCQLYTQDYLKNFDNDIQEILDKKSNNNEIITYLNSKANLNEMTQQLDKKVSKTEFESFKLTLDQIANDYQNKIDYQKFDSFVNSTTQQLDLLQRDMILKANMKEMIEHLNEKADIDLVNKALNVVHDELDNRISFDQFNQAIDNQNIINSLISKENTIGKWIWQSGDVKNGFLVPWEEEIINTSPENFIWEKERVNITINESGMYLICAVFFVMDQPNIQVIINGNPILSKVKSTDEIIRHEIISESEEFKGNFNCGMSGISLKEYLNLEGEKTRISISYSGSDNVKGLLCLKKV